MQERPNLDYVEELANGDEAFKAKFIAIIKEEFPLEVAEYLDNVENKRPRATSENVHKLKHKFNILGLHEGYRLAVRYEEDLRLGDTTLEGDFKAILETISDYIKTIRP